MTMKLISTVEVGSGGAASISFASIPQDATDLLVVYSTRDGDTDGSVVYLNPNGLTTNQATRFLRGNGSSATSSTSTRLYGRGNSSNYTSNTFSNGNFYVPNYTSASYKSVSSDSVEETNATGAYSMIMAGLWSSTSAITSITLTPGVGNFAQYSTASLYTITKGSGGATVA